MNTISKIAKSAGPLAVCIPSFRLGGAERVAVNLIAGLHERGIPVEAVVAHADGPLACSVPSDVPVIDLNVARLRSAILPLASYFRDVRPRAVISHVHHLNAAVVCARTLSRPSIPLVLVEHNTLEEKLGSAQVRPGLRRLLRWAYTRRHVSVVGVSHGVADSLARALSIPRRAIEVIANPVVDREFHTRAEQHAGHPWCTDGTVPLIVSVGRMVPHKDFAVLLSAFAMLRERRTARLLILGDGPCRDELLTMRSTLPCAADVDLPGAVDNPLPYFRSAHLVALASRFEGLPTVLIEALACGCPCVATDCRSGPREILADGRYGLLTPVGDAGALAAALDQALNRTWDHPALARHGAEYSVDAAVERYLQVALECEGIAA